LPHHWIWQTELPDTAGRERARLGGQATANDQRNTATGAHFVKQNVALSLNSMTWLPAEEWNAKAFHDKCETAIRN
jgi:hypothetical protein